jgi:hypothetical protein
MLGRPIHKIACRVCCRRLEADDANFLPDTHGNLHPYCDACADYRLCAKCNRVTDREHITTVYVKEPGFCYSLAVCPACFDFLTKDLKKRTSNC